MKISILLPTYNRKRMVMEAIQKILHYDDPAVTEIVVSDNHSTDESFSELRKKFLKHGKIRITQPPRHCSAIENWKHCLDQASGTHVHWHWSDDQLCAPFYRWARQRVNESKCEIVMGPVHMWYDRNFMPIFYSQLEKRELSGRDALRHLFTDGSLPYSPAAYILPLSPVRKHFYDRIPPLEELDPVKYAMGPDALMIAGCLMEAEKIAFLDQPVIRFRHHAGSISVQNSHLFKNYALSFEFFQRTHNLKIIPEQVRVNLYGEKIVNFNRPAKPKKKKRFSGWVARLKEKFRRNKTDSVNMAPSSGPSRSPDRDA